MYFNLSNLFFFKIAAILTECSRIEQRSVIICFWIFFFFFFWRGMRCANLAIFMENYVTSMEKHASVKKKKIHNLPKHVFWNNEAVSKKQSME